MVEIGCFSKELHRIKRHINNSDAEIEFDEEAFAKRNSNWTMKISGWFTGLLQVAQMNVV